MDRNWKAIYKRGASGFWQIDLREFMEYGLTPGRRSMRDPGHTGAGLWWEEGRRTRNKAEALSWLSDYWELTRSLLTGSPAGGRFTRDLVDAYVAERTALYSSSTAVKSKHAALELYADHGGANLKAVTITATLERLRREPKERGTGMKSPKHLAGIFDALRTFIKWLNEAPRSAGIPIPTRPSWLHGASKVTQKEGYNAEEVDRVLECADAEGVGDIARLCLATGTRIMEAFGLRWEDIERTEDGTLLVHVHAQASRKDMDATVETKSRKERWSIVGEHGAELALGMGRTGFILDRAEAKTCNAAYTRALEAADLKRPRELWHMLRHTFALHCLERGASYESLSVWLGHSGPHITRAHYPGMDARSRALHGLKAMEAQKATVTPAGTL